MRGAEAGRGAQRWTTPVTQRRRLGDDDLLAVEQLVISSHDKQLDH
jgi:hypothetical protein